MNILMLIFVCSLSLPICCMEDPQVKEKEPAFVLGQKNDTSDEQIADQTDWPKYWHEEFLKKNKDKPVSALLDGMSVCGEPLISAEVENFARQYPDAINTPYTLKKPLPRWKLASSEEDLSYLGWTPFACAVGNKDPYFVDILIRYGADLNKPDANHVTPLMHAHRKEVMKALLMAGADPNYLNPDGQTPLVYALIHDREPAIISMLINAGANIHTQLPVFQQTALHGAIHSSEHVALLLQKGANPYSKTIFGKTAYDHASSCAKTNCRGHQSCASTALILQQAMQKGSWWQYISAQIIYVKGLLSGGLESRQRIQKFIFPPVKKTYVELLKSGELVDSEKKIA